MMTLEVELFSSKNSRQIFKNRKTNTSFVAKSSVSKRNEKDLLQILSCRNKKELWSQMKMGKNYPLYVQFKIYRRTNHKYDFTNIIQNLADCLVESGYIPDDCWRYFIPVFTPHEKDANNPRVEIVIL